jgi:DnaK suppressor protein
MSSKKPNKPVRKPAKALPKKAAPKSVARKRPARPATKAGPKFVSPKVPLKPTKPAPKAAASKSTAAKPAVAKALSTKATPLAATAPKPQAARAAAEKSAPVNFDVKSVVVQRPPLDDEGDVESPLSASLLAGPRNVKPYISRRGEQYMNKGQLEHFARILQNWKRDLMVEVDRTVLHMKDEAANFPDPNDRATQEEEFSLELRTRDRERKLIRKIDEALKRVEDGNYGYCLETGEEIGIKRLEARPVATLSVEAQERRERREKQYGDRDDRYR